LAGNYSLNGKVNVLAIGDAVNHKRCVQNPKFFLKFLPKENELRRIFSAPFMRLSTPPERMLITRKQNLRRGATGDFPQREHRKCRK
jgi:hypothetical protein